MVPSWCVRILLTGVPMKKFLLTISAVCLAVGFFIAGCFLLTSYVRLMEIVNGVVFIFFSIVLFRYALRNRS